MNRIILFALLTLSFNHLLFADSQTITTRSDFEQADISDYRFTLSDDGEAVQDHGMEPDTGSRVTLSLPKKLFDQASVLIGNSIVLAGGVDETSYSQAVYINPIESDTLTAWQNGPDLPLGIRGHKIVKYDSHVLCLGGRTNTGLSTTIYQSTFDFNQHTLSTWQAVGTMPVELENYDAVTHQGKLYIIGGKSSITVSTVYYADFNPDGSLTAWQTTTALPEALSDHAAAVYGNRLFVSGGHNGSTSSGIVYSALINQDGTLGSWDNTGVLPQVSRHALVSTSSGLIRIGGYNSSYLNNIQSTFLQTSTGGPDSWSTSTLYNLADCTAFVYNQKLYILGGRDASSLKDSVELIPLTAFSPWKPSTAMTEPNKGAEELIGIHNYVYYSGGLGASGITNAVYRSKFNSEGNGLGIWSNDLPMPNNLLYHSVAAYNDRIYIMGGQTDGGSNTNTVYFTNQINEGDGIITDWTYTTPLPHVMYAHGSIAHNDKLYIFDGASVYYNSINSDGTLGWQWKQTAGLPVPSQPTCYPFIANNKIYIITNDTKQHFHYANIRPDGLLDPWQETTAPITSSPSIFIHDDKIFTAPVPRWSLLNPDGSIQAWHNIDYVDAYYSPGINIINNYINVFDSLFTPVYTKLTTYRSNYLFPFYFSGDLKNLKTISWESTYPTHEYTLQYRVYNQGWGNWIALDPTQTTGSVNQTGSALQLSVAVNTYKQDNGSIGSITLDYDGNVATATPTPLATPTPIITPEGFDGKIISKHTTYAYPNPSRGGTAKFNIYTKEPSKVTLKIYTTSNRFVWSKVIETSQIGDNLIEWHYHNMANGAYIYLVKVKGLNSGIEERVIKKIAIIK